MDWRLPTLLQIHTAHLVQQELLPVPFPKRNPSYSHHAIASTFPHNKLFCSRVECKRPPTLPFSAKTRFVTNIDQPKTINVLYLPMIDFFFDPSKSPKIEIDAVRDRSRFFLPFNKNYFTSKFYMVLEILDKSWVRALLTPENPSQLPRGEEGEHKQ
jgi:hypothetical protein